MQSALTLLIAVFCFSYNALASSNKRLYCSIFGPDSPQVVSMIFDGEIENGLTLKNFVTIVDRYNCNPEEIFTAKLLIGKSIKLGREKIETIEFEITPNSGIFPEAAHKETLLVPTGFEKLAESPLTYEDITVRYRRYEPDLKSYDEQLFECSVLREPIPEPKPVPVPAPIPEKQ